ncbi:MAG TPA: PEP-CTERM sorting domain-containing protein [Phenylobacterium sp.]|uniref:PEP-CTERM sorting domain-containing protein n=1 Tax=Phenylobacterium sp. TaxID=1871053 RepID=UPI002D75EB18|nr:PEP-CTERM sorting domain-containing protein [Phenylobacterium sp.]HZZ69259.1 PEP-CTERM sorting domain-containing protein [Phenylobacterium sp.]
MLKRLLTGATITLVTSLALAQAAHAGGVVTFEDRAPGPTDGAYATAADAFVDGGLDFAGGQFSFIPPSDVAVTRPFSANGVFMETFLADTDTSLLTVTLDGGGVFDLASLHLGLGGFNSSDLDTVEVTGTQASCGGGPPCTVTADLVVGPRFQLYDVTGFTDLTSVSFGPQTIGADGKGANDTGFLAFDGVSYGTAGSPAPPGVPDPVPEPAAWALTILGLGGVGASLRSRRAAGLAA